MAVSRCLHPNQARRPNLPIKPFRVAGRLHLCTSQQSSLKSRRDNASAITFTAEEGKVYYFRTQPSPTSLAQSAASRVPNGKVELAAVYPAQAQLMVPEWAYSTSQLKK